MTGGGNMELNNPTNAAIYAQVEKNRAKGCCYVCGNATQQTATCQEHSSIEAQAVRMFGKPLDIAPKPDTMPQVVNTQ